MYNTVSSVTIAVETMNEQSCPDYLNEVIIIIIRWICLSFVHNIKNTTTNTRIFYISLLKFQ